MSNFLQFKWVECKNLASVGNMPIRILLDRSPTTAVLGNNGAGKSSLILDSICFALFGKPFRNINKGQLVNNKNNKDLLSTISFKRGNDDIKVVRGIKPAVFEIWVNDKMVDQSSKTRDYQKYFEEQILGIDYNSFTQIVMIGKANYVPFMSLKAADKRQFVERILGLDVFTAMSGCHKIRVDEHTHEYNDVKTDITIVGEKIKSQQRLVEHLESDAQTNAQTKRDDIVRQIEIERGKKSLLEIERKGLKDKLTIINVEELRSNTEQSAARANAIDDLVSSIRANKIGAENDISFMNDHDNCPTCRQSISPTFKEMTISSKSNKLAQFNRSLDELAEKLKVEKERQSGYNDIINSVKTLLTDINAIDRLIGNHDDNIKQLTNSLSSVIIDNSKIDAEKKILADLMDNLRELYERYNALTEESNYLRFMSMCLKDSGIKSTIIQEFVPVINTIINQNAKQLGLFAHITIDDQFKEEIKMRGFESMSYNQLSEGEKLRLDMAIMMAWRDVAKFKANMSCNLLIMDEIFDSSVDSEGTAAFADLLKSVAGLNVFVITHTPEKLADSFRSFIRLEKKDGFTTMTNTGNY